MAFIFRLHCVFQVVDECAKDEGSLEERHCLDPDVQSVCQSLPQILASWCEVHVPTTTTTQEEEEDTETSEEDEEESDDESSKSTAATPNQNGANQADLSREKLSTLERDKSNATQDKLKFTRKALRARGFGQKAKTKEGQGC